MLFRAILLTMIGLAIGLSGPNRPAQAETLLLDEITVRGEQLPQIEETLTVREVRESAARDMGEALQQLPGLSVVRKGAIANDVVVRGLQGDDINVLLDGVRIHGGCPSRMDPPSFHFDFAEVETIDVVKGPYDVENPGSLGGVINAKSKRPAQGPGFSAGLTYGSADLIDASTTVSHGSDLFDILAGYAYKYSRPPRSGDGKRITEIYPESSSNRYRDDDLDSRAYDINTVWVKGGGQLSAKARTELSYTYQDADHVLYPYLLMDADYDRTSRVNWTTTVDDLGPVFKTLVFQAWWNEVEHLMHDSYRVSSLPSATVTRAYSMQTDASTETYGAKLKGRWAVGTGTLESGLDYYLRNWDARNVLAMSGYTPQPLIPDVDSDNFGAFATYALPLGAGWSLKAGVRVDATTADAGALSKSRLGTLFQPYYPGDSLDRDADFTEVSGNVQTTWRASDALELFAGFGSGSRPPDPQELYINLQRRPTMMRPNVTNWLGNPELAPTRNNQCDLGARFSGEGWFARLSLFYSKLDDYIDVVERADPDGTTGPLVKARSYRNVDATLWGGEASGQIALPGDFYVKGMLSYVHGENDDTDEPLAEMPPLLGNVSLRYDVDRWFVELTERFADRQERVDDSLGETETAGWGVTDLKAGLNRERWTVTAGVNNLLDKYYFTHLAYQRDPFRSGFKVPETGAFAYLTVTYRY